MAHINAEPATPEEATTRLVAFFEHLQPSHLPTLGQLYAADAAFKDPFNEVQGVAAIARIFEHMFATLVEPRFVVTTQVLQGSQCFLTWDFVFRTQGQRGAEPMRIRGASHLVFNNQGLVELHRDYWDAAEELYEKLPVVGSLMRWMKAKARA